ncbi:hypothetical protein EDC96DRAFT_548243 [Choanephora cucurbitarum]|nr:hypothetical protein EDC96DRAFT_548243 [Choanephora cucurbitarum]
MSAPLPDLVVSKNSDEYCCAEYGREDRKDANWKEAVEGSLKLPKELNRLGSDKQEQMKQVKVFGFLCIKLRMTVEILDFPANYVCRLLKLEEVKVPCVEEEVAEKSTEVVEVMWKIKVERAFVPTERSTLVQRKRRARALPDNGTLELNIKLCLLKVASFLGEYVPETIRSRKGPIQINDLSKQYHFSSSSNFDFRTLHPFDSDKVSTILELILAKFCKCYQFLYFGQRTPVSISLIALEADIELKLA